MSENQSPQMQEAPVEEPATLKETYEENEGQFYCALHETPSRELPPGIVSERARLINLLGNKWVSGTELRYYFFDRQTDGQKVMAANGASEWRTWVGAENQKEVVRRGFKVWEDVGIGVTFKEVNNREDAEIRIGFMQGNGAWSYLGRDILKFGPNERTMNFGWDLSRPREIDTAIHEIGHTLGFPHEHQNPKAGIEWDEEAVYAALAKPPNSWDRNKTYWNIIRKLDPNEVEGTTWDPDSVMHYPFGAGLIKKPQQYANGIRPAGGLSAKDKAWAKELYPPVPKPDDEPELKPAQSVLLQIAPGENKSFRINPKETRYYKFGTFGTSDSVLVLFEDDNGQLRYRTGDDDSGKDLNAYFRVKLIKNRKYVLRLRLYYTDRPGETSVMMW